MQRVYLSLGSNIRRYHFIGAGLEALSARYGELRVSPVYESPAIGFDGPAFLNLVVGFDTAEPLPALAAALRAIEDAHGREPDAPKFSARTLDIDILTYGDRHGDCDGLWLPRSELDGYAFMLCPLADIAPAERHPRSGQSYAWLWQRLARRLDGEQPLRRVAFHWRGRELSATAPGAGQAGGGQR